MIFVVWRYEGSFKILVMSSVEIKHCFCLEERFGLLSGVVELVKTLSLKWEHGIQGVFLCYNNGGKKFGVQQLPFSLNNKTQKCSRLIKVNG